MPIFLVPAHASVIMDDSTRNVFGFLPQIKKKETLNCILCIYLRFIFAATDFMVDVFIASRVIHMDRGVG